MLLLESCATRDAERCLFETPCRLRSRSATFGQCQHDDFATPGTLGELEPISNSKRVRWLHALAVEMHFAAGDGRARLRTALIEARAPEPLVDADLYTRVLTLLAHPASASVPTVSGYNARPFPQREPHVKHELLQRLAADTERLREQGLYKVERVLASPQQARVRVSGGAEVLNLCANNYLGLANHPAVREAAHRALDRYGYGMASVRFICGTQTIHKELEERLSRFLGTEDTILYSSCFDANGGLFETLLDEQDAVISDALNHASIIDGIRLCKAERLRYANSDLEELEKHLKATQGRRTRLIATDGVFSMDGTLARLKEICDLAERYGALVMVDDSHAVGFMGANGRGTHEHCGVLDRVDILTGTLGKALGGASGGYTSARREIIAWLRQRSRPYLFSNSIAPVVAAASVRVLDLLEGSPEFRERLFDNTRFFREQLAALGLHIIAGEHPIIPIMLGDARVAVDMADRLLAEGVYVVGFSFPVVPQGKARIRTQMSAGLTREDLQRAIAAFGRVARAMNLAQ